MAAIMRFEEIQSWQMARELTNTIYGLTQLTAFSKDFGLRDQIRRAAVSVMSNLPRKSQVLYLILGLILGNAAVPTTKLDV